MTALAFSRLAVAVLAEHQRREGEGGLLVVPVVCPWAPPEDLGLDAFRRAVVAADGIALNCRELAGGVTGARAPLADEIEGLLPDPDEPTRSAIQIQAAGPNLTVMMSDGTRAIGSAGVETLAGAALAPLDSRLLGAPIAVVSYDESVLDRSAADGVWNIFCLRVPQHDFGALRTLVVLCHGSGVTPYRHYGTHASARYIIRGNEMSERRPWDVDREEVRRLSEEATSPAVLFLGAGFTASSRTTDGSLPMGNELRDRALRRLVGNFPSDLEAARRFRQFCEGRDALLSGEADMSLTDFARRLTFERVLNVEFAGEPDPLGPTLTGFADEVAQARDDPGEAVLKLKEILESGRKLILVTVNLDDIPEHVCGGLVQPYAGAQLADGAQAVVDYVGGNGAPAPLMKIHGDLQDPGSIIATVESVARGLSQDKVGCFEALLGLDALHPRLVFYIGASMRDRDISQLIGLPTYAQRLDEWWVGPSRDSSVERFIADVRVEPWAEAGRGRIAPGARCITLTADVFMSQLALHLA